MLAGGLYERTSGAAGQPLTGYRRREPERTVLHELVARHAQTMLAEVRAADPEGRGLPRHVERLAILDRIVRRIARRLADEARDDSVEEGVDVLAQVQAEAAATWRSPQNGKPTVRGVEPLRAWCEGFSLHAGVVTGRTHPGSGLSTSISGHRGNDQSGELSPTISFDAASSPAVAQFVACRQGCPAVTRLGRRCCARCYR